MLKLGNHVDRVGDERPPTPVLSRGDGGGASVTTAVTSASELAFRDPTIAGELFFSFSTYTTFVVNYKFERSAMFQVICE